MKFQGWEKVKIKNKANTVVDAVAPLIISASRSTDIPAFYSDWFINRIKAGYTKWINPFNNRPQYVSFVNTRVIVFWTKNPAPIIKYLPLLDNMNYNYYFLFTLNDYEAESLENVPPINQRIETFISLAEKIGNDKVLWRFDPVILTNKTNIDDIIERIYIIGEHIHKYTKRLIFSFVDIDKYKSVSRNLKSFSQNTGIIFNKITKDDKQLFAKKLSDINKSWYLDLRTCAEDINLIEYGINANRCINDVLMKEIFNNDKELMNFINKHNENNLFNNNNLASYPLKDRGQRKLCKCMYSKDIGQYNTCGHMCKYCYANHQPNKVLQRIKNHNPLSEEI